MAALLALYRVRTILLIVGVATVLLNLVAARVMPLPHGIGPVTTMVGLVLVALSLILAAVGPRWLPDTAVRTVVSPVAGRWLALNSPATKVPSHGVRGHGQTFAIDLVADPEDGSRPAFGGTAMRAADAYPAFGMPVHAMIDGTVVSVSQWHRDHRARSNLMGLVYLMVEGMIRDLFGPTFLIGNFVVIRGTDGVFAAVAHLRRGSVRVRPGESVRAGDVIAQCGNSGNSSEPHVHAQLMDRASFWTANGLPVAFADIQLGDAPDSITGCPGTGDHLTAAPSPQPAR